VRLDLDHVASFFFSPRQPSVGGAYASSTFCIDRHRRTVSKESKVASCNVCVCAAALITT
jgi:hypothetical protein